MLNIFFADDEATINTIGISCQPDEILAQLPDNERR